MATPPQNPHEHDQPEPDVSRGHEYSDLRLRAIIIAAAVLVVGTVVIMFGVHALMQATTQSQAMRGAPASPLLPRGPDGQIQHPLPPGPLLEPYSPEHPNLPYQDYLAARADAQHKLTTYGVAPADPNDPSRARIPIDRAIELTIKNGLDKGVVP